MSSIEKKIKLLISNVLSDSISQRFIHLDREDLCQTAQQYCSTRASSNAQYYKEEPYKANKRKESRKHGSEQYDV